MPWNLHAGGCRTSHSKTRHNRLIYLSAWSSGCVLSASVFHAWCAKQFTKCLQHKLISCRQPLKRVDAVFQVRDFTYSHQRWVCTHTERIWVAYFCLNCLHLLLFIHFSISLLMNWWFAFIVEEIQESLPLWAHLCLRVDFYSNEQIKSLFLFFLRSH